MLGFATLDILLFNKLVSLNFYKCLDYFLAVKDNKLKKGRIHM